eukprot:6330692-Pyramimonas_sp.AAC.1
MREIEPKFLPAWVKRWSKDARDVPPLSHAVPKTTMVSTTGKDNLSPSNVWMATSFGQSSKCFPMMI